MISGGITATAVIDGENGDNGYSSAVVQLYRRYAPTQVAPTPALPTGALIYTFATGVLSGATASFNGWSQQIPAASADTKLFVTQATATSQDATDEISVNDWSTPVEYVKDGTKGDNGEAAVNVIVTPASLIVNQSLDNPSNLDSLSEQILFQVEKGSTPLNVTKIDSIVVEKDGNRNKISVTGSNSNYATLTAILKDADTNGKYYDQAYFTCRVAYADGGTTKYVTDVKVKVYANLLGSWSEEVKGDTKNEVARSLSYAYIQDGQGVQTLEQIGTYTKSSTENISTLTKKVDNGKNLLRNALSGSGSFGCSTAKNFTNNPSLRDTTVDYDGYITAAENYTYIFQSGITIERGKWHTVSFEAKSNQTNVGFCVFNYSGDGSVFSGDNCDTNFTPRTSGKKKSITFRVSGTGTVTVAISIKCAALRYPQLELGETATAFESGGTDISSRIKQEADHIEMKVKDTGIDIDEKTITLSAEKTTITGDLTVPRVMNVANGMMTTIEAGKVRIESTTTQSYGLFQVNADGEIVLKMVDKDGHVVANIGGSSTMHAGSWEATPLKRVDSGGTVVDSKANFTAYSTDLTTYYKLTLGRVENGAGNPTYYTPDGNSTIDPDVIALDGHLFTSQADSAAAIKALAKVSGYYVKRNDGIFFREPSATVGEEGDYIIQVYHYFNGKMIEIETHTFSS